MTQNALIVLRMFVFVAAAAVLPNHVAVADDAPKATTKLTVLHKDFSQPRVVLVQLYVDGKVIRSRELDCYSNDGANEVTWEKVPAGKCELHFESVGHGKCVKSLFLSEDDKDIKIKVQFDPNKKIAIVGGGPSLQEVLDELKELKKINADLKKSVEELQIELAKLKKP